MRIYLYKPELDYTYCEIWVSDKEITEENWKEYRKDIIKIYNQNFIKFVDIQDINLGLTEIKNPSEKLIQAVVRHKVLLMFTDAVSEVTKNIPFSLMKGLDKIIITYEGCGDLCSHSVWDDGFEDMIY